MTSVEVEIFGRMYRLRGEDPDKVRRYAAYLNAQLNDLAARMEFTDSTRVLSLAGMVLTEQLFAERDRNDTLQKEIDRLRGLVDNFLNEHNRTETPEYIDK